MRGKLQLRSTGPYKFIRYKGEKRLVAEIQSDNGKIRECSVV
jgi:hypothetical protein